MAFSPVIFLNELLEILLGYFRTDTDSAFCHVLCLATFLQYIQLERDLQQVLDEKEEHVTERDAYKSKYERLNAELNYILKGDEKRVVDIDALVMENK